MEKRKFALKLLILMLGALSIDAASATLAVAAEYNGHDVDGESFECSAYSYDTGNYYDVTVVFDGAEATITFPNGGERTLTLDDEEIDDPSGISAFEYESGNYWDLDVAGMDIRRSLKDDLKIAPFFPSEELDAKPVTSS